ncbi:MAG: hypothetical protein J5841_08500 [Clostridia bacterium]|nr:hypothetical protein [Clostridia bacterium]
MPNRILKECILTDKKYNMLSLMEESIYHRLLVSVDDYGVLYADPTLLSRILFPRKPEIDGEAVRKGLKHMEKLGLICCYTADGEEFLKICSWEKDQRLRNTRHKFPMPEQADQAEPAEPVQEQPAGEPEMPAEDTADIAEPQERPEVKELPVAEIPLNDNTAYGVTREEAEEYSRLYPAVDVVQELRNMRGWSLSNPQKRKTRSGVKKFINNWLARAQNDGGSNPRFGPKAVPANPFLSILKEEAPNEGGQAEPAVF